MESNLPVKEVRELKTQVRDLTRYVDDWLDKQNDMNESSRIQFERIRESLAELHTSFDALQNE